MFDPRYTTIITGAAGQLGVRLLPLLGDFSIYAVDIKPPEIDCSLRFELMDLGREACCRELVTLLRDTGAANVVHLAFVPDLDATHDPQRAWQINVAGTARVMEAIAEVNRMGGGVRKFIFTSSATVYGSGLSYPVKEDTPPAAHSLASALHKQEADEVVQLRVGSLGACSAYILRAQTYGGAGADSLVLRALRGEPPAKGLLAGRLRRQERRVPLIASRGQEHLDRPHQFVHLDDAARLLAWILHKPERSPELHILNVAGRGEPLTLRRCAEIAGAQIVQIPTMFLCRWAFKTAAALGVSPVPVEALAYLLAPPVVDTTRLRAFLGSEYEHVIRHTMEEAFADCFCPARALAVHDAPTGVA